MWSLRSLPLRPRELLGFSSTLPTTLADLSARVFSCINTYLPTLDTRKDLVLIQDYRPLTPTTAS